MGYALFEIAMGVGFGTILYLRYRDRAHRVRDTLTVAGIFIFLLATFPLFSADCRLALQHDALAALYGAESSACTRLSRSRAGLSIQIGLTLASTLAAMATLLHALRRNGRRGPGSPVR